MQNHYFDKNGYYTYSGVANPDNACPLTATREAPEQHEGYHPKWDGEVWGYVKDLRGTKYYMPDGSVCEITEIEGQVPEEGCLNKPEPTEAEKIQQRIIEIQQELVNNDLASVRPLRAKVAGTATEADEVRLSELEEQAQKLRVELAVLLVK